MPLTVAERKHRLPHGAQKKIAAKRHVDRAYVSRAVASEVFPKTERAQLKLAGVLRDVAACLGLPLEDAFDTEELERAGLRPLARAS